MTLTKKILFIYSTVVVDVQYPIYLYVEFTSNTFTTEYKTVYIIRFALHYTVFKLRGILNTNK